VVETRTFLLHREKAKNSIPEGHVFVLVKLTLPGIRAWMLLVHVLNSHEFKFHHFHH